jgi:hypothetical protein
MTDYARFDSITIFSEIARENYKSFRGDLEEYERLNRVLSTLTQDDDQAECQHNIYTIMHRLGKAGVVIIIFSAFTLEAYIYDYAARKLSDSYVHKYLDKLDVVSKWIIIPHLVTGKPFPVGTRGIELLRDLTRERNSIAHSKSSDAFSLTEADMDKQFQRIENFPRKVTQAIAALDTLAVEMEQLDPGEYTSLLFDAPVGKNQTAAIS